MATDNKENIIIIGGGIIGCTTAYYLTRHPTYDPAKHNITLVEATSIAGGASGKAGGLLALWAYPSCLVPLSYRLHSELAAEHNGQERWGYRRIHCGELSAKGRLAGSATNGSTTTKGAEGDSTPLPKRSKAALETLRAAGIPKDLDWFAPDCVQSYDSMGDPENTAQVHPYQFTTAMAALAEEKGANMILGTVTSLNISSPSSSTPTIDSVTYTPKDSSSPTTLPASTIILAAGPWSRTVYPPAPISALRAHSITIRPSRPVSAYALFTQVSIPASKGAGAAQIASPEIYARPNNEVYACGEGDTIVPLPSTTTDVQVDEKRCADIVRAVTSMSEELRDGEVTARQACYLPQVSGVGVSGPLIGKTGVTGLVMAAGHTCWGIQNGPGTGKVVSEIVFEGKAKSANVKSLDPSKIM
ncbi:MAG: hypothetical protein M1833_001403 [Piccolia ochrophora]|nr:MAG: hypothetical protein M1833_001403 [Piccolia ochrophora]